MVAAAAVAAATDPVMTFKITLFTVEEANALAHEVRPGLDRLARIKTDLDRLEVRAEVLGLTVSAGGSAAGPEARELEELQSRRGVLAGEIARGVEAIQRRGCLVKDIGAGLLDFYALRGDRLVFLCWRRDEPEISHWHPLESGFSGRLPLDTSELE
jgi:hypothetical protein